METYIERLRSAVITVLDDTSAYCGGTLYTDKLKDEATRILHGDFETPELFLGEISREDELLTEMLLKTLPAVLGRSLTSHTTRKMDQAAARVTADWSVPETVKFMADGTPLIPVRVSNKQLSVWQATRCTPCGKK